MTRVLIKKQLNELFRAYFVNAKTGKLRPKRSIVAFFLMYVLILAFVGVAFYSMADFLAQALMPAGMSWLYYSILGLLSSAFGIVGSVFNTYSGLYHAKDNELLLSMPVKSSSILVSRIVPVYMLALMYTSPIYIASLVAAFKAGASGTLQIILSVVLMFILSFLVTAFTCLLGWVVASVSVKLKNKNIITVILSLVLVGGYYFMTTKISTYLSMVISNAEAIGAKIKTLIFPYYALGKACDGSVPYFLAFSALSLAAFAVVCAVLSANFVKITTSSARTTKHKLRKQSAMSVKKALLNKELKRFVASPTYMLNCGMGIVFLLAASVALLIKSDLIAQAFEQIHEYDFMMPVLVTAVAFTLCSGCDISAPSVSLEGKNIWIVKSLPIATEDILKAKTELQVYINMLPTLFFAVVCGIVLKIETFSIVLMAVASAAYVVFSSMAGVMLNLKFPNLTWTNETMPIKQSMPVFISMFGGWGVSIAIGGIYYLLSDFISPTLYLLMIITVFAVLTVLLYRLMVTAGKKMFEEL